MSGANGLGDRWTALELRHLIALKAVAEEGSFRAAAERLGYVQSAVSQQIASLERIVGRRLVERSRGTKRPSLTEAGRLLLAHADATIARMRLADAELRASDEDGPRVLRVGSFQHVSSRIVPRALGHLRRIEPAVEVRLVEHETDLDVLEPLHRGELDLAFAGPVPQARFECRELFADPYVILAGAGSALAKLGRPVTLREATAEGLIGHSGKRPRVEQHLAALGIPENVVFRSDLNATIQGLVAAGVGVAIVPRFSVDPGAAETVLLELDPPDAVPPWRVAIAWSAERPLSRPAAGFVDAVALACSELGLAGVCEAA